MPTLNGLWLKNLSTKYLVISATFCNFVASNRYHINQ